jgi:ectoine hydroxylase-related dioxygenase (phytanoyl-CoA dioxygenase family)
MSVVTEEHRRAYNEVGTVHIPGVIDQAGVQSLTTLIDDVINGLRSGAIERRTEPNPVFRDIEFEDHDGYIRLVNAMARVPQLREWLLQSGLAPIVGDVIGASSLRMWLDAAFSKVGLAKETATPWHNDECTFSFQGEHLPSLWMGLTDVDEGNAPLITLAGSHKDTHRYHSPFSPQDVERPPNCRPWSELLARTAAPDADIRVWTVKAGDILIIHPKTIHASLPRTGDASGRRLAFTVRFIGSDVVWDPTPLTMLSPFDTHPMMERGKPPPEALFPVVWRR